MNVQLAGAMQVVGLLDVMRCHPDHILTMVFKIFVNVATLVPGLIHHKFHAQKESTPTLLDQYHVFHVHQGSILISKVVLNVQTAPLVTFNQSQNKKNGAVPAGRIVATGGSASVVVPEGSKINASEPSGFAACPAGTKGSIPPNETCTKCLAGESSAAGATTCQPCDKGKFSSAPGSICQDCPAGTFQEQNTLPSSECQTCPAGWEQPLEGSPSCTSLNWKTIEICNKENDMYLNNTSSSPSNWTCEPCPPGGDCSYAVAWKDLKPKFGWWKIPTKERDDQRQAFAECLFAPACLGGVNKLLVARHPEAAAEHRNRTCNTELGFRNTSRLCHTCATGYKRKGTNRCDECPPSAGENVGLVILGVVLILLVLVYLVGDAINDAGNQSLSGSIQKIILNYLQVVTLFNGFPLRWPAELEFLFEAQGAVSTVGEHLVNPDCLSTGTSAAELYYSKQ